MQNIDIRILVSDSHISYRQLAKKIGISHEWLSKLMAKPLSHTNRIRILDALAEIQEGSSQ